VSAVEDCIKEFQKTIQELLLQMDPEAARQFATVFTEKLDEQKRAQENSGTSR
jgi:hypothetical protein